MVACIIRGQDHVIRTNETQISDELVRLIAFAVGCEAYEVINIRFLP